DDRRDRLLEAPRRSFRQTRRVPHRAVYLHAVPARLLLLLPDLHRSRLRLADPPRSLVRRDHPVALGDDRRRRRLLRVEERPARDGDHLLGDDLRSQVWPQRRWLTRRDDSRVLRLRRRTRGASPRDREWHQAVGQRLRLAALSHWHCGFVLV